MALFLASGGKCGACGSSLLPGWHADHKQAWTHGGPTDVVNGQALCPACNLSKGDRSMGWTGPSLRGWQRAHLIKLLSEEEPAE
ncbi:HNH endonuclease signature motif containing protein [Streptomyces sp. NBC_01334]|uniref:HNH endonuclease signature motif containing protein n=1 Tax=Streptomyces sp. NBC_01334 TaxID=2903827 RepID=UPI003FA3700C